MRIFPILLLLQLSINTKAIAAIKMEGSDTTIVGVLIASDSIRINPANLLSGTYYYGVHHYAIGRLDVRTGKVTDTVIVAMVFNIKTESKLYLKNFGLKAGRKYIFDVHNFTPCDSDFPRLEGRCDPKSLQFFPDSKTLIDSYRQIFRIINFFEFKNSNRG